MEKRIIRGVVGYGLKGLNRLAFPRQKDNGSIIRFDPSIETDNLGDYIIMQYCGRVLDELFPEHTFVNIGTHHKPTNKQENDVKRTKYKFVCGTNLLTSNIEHHWRWILPDGVRRKWNYRNSILLGVGWGEYQEECSDYSRMIYRAIMNPCVQHSVRDQYTMHKLQVAGIKNVINTGCPTIWALTPDFCHGIPKRKAAKVVATLTDYRRDPKHDNELLAILSRNYDQIYLWLQGKQDEDYLHSLNVPDNLSIIPSSLEAYEAVLRKGNVDYVGTRLHAGIHALNYRIRSIILAVDNRALEMGRDVNLPIVPREEIGAQLEEMICSEWKTDIHIRQKEISKFLRQFGK